MSREKQNDELVQMYRDLGEIFDEEYKKRGLITPSNTAEKMTEKGYRKQSEWISVDERFPDLDERCLLCMEGAITKYKWVTIDYYQTDYDKHVTHWMPLPEPPKMRKEDEGK